MDHFCHGVLNVYTNFNRSQRAQRSLPRNRNRGKNYEITNAGKTVRIDAFERKVLMRLQGVLGIAVFLGVAWIISEKRKSVKMATILTGVAVQFAIGGLLLYVPLFKRAFVILNNVVLAL